MTFRKLTQAELCAEAAAAFGADTLNWAFKCPNCGDVAAMSDYPEKWRALVGQQCIGRILDENKDRARDPHGKFMGGRGCDWAAYGLLPGPWEVVVPADGDGPETSVYSFPLAVPA